MYGPCAAVNSLRGGNGVVHRTSLVGSSGRGVLEEIVGFFGVMASQKISVSYDKASSFLLNNFAKGDGGWGFCRAAVNPLAILMAPLSADDLKGVL